MRRERLSDSLLVELDGLEEDAHRLCLQEATRIGRGPPAVALRAVAGHANEALEELSVLARARGLRLGAVKALAAGALHGLREAVLRRVVDEEHAYRHTLATLRRAIGVTRRTNAAAIAEGDDALATWCQRWLRGREQLVDDAADELTWFVHHAGRAHARATPA